MSETQVYQAILAAVKAVPGMVPMSVPAKPFDSPADGSAYANFTHHPNVPETFTLGNSGEDQQTGFSQVLLRYPPDKGIFDASRLGDVLRSNFKAGQRLIYEDQVVVIVRSGLGQFSIVDNRLVNPFTIYWYALIRR